MDPHPTIRLIAKHKLCYESYKAICGDISAFVTMQPSLLLANIKQIHLIQNETNKKCLELARKGNIEIPFRQHQDIAKKCSEMFAIEVSVDFTHLALNIMLSSQDQSLAILDQDFMISDVLKVFKIAYDHLSQKVSTKINRKLKNYIKTTKRSEEDKKLLILMYDAQKSNQNYEAEYRGDIQKKQSGRQNQRSQANQGQKKYSKNQPRAQRNERRENNWRGNRYGNRNSNDKQNWNKKSQDNHYRKNSKEKQIDKRILLGINGDTQEGWRARYRPQRVAKGNQIQNYSREQDVKVERKPNQTEPKKQTQVMQSQETRRQISTSNALRSTFSFPKDGKTFDFSKLKQFMLFINGQFWIKYVGGTLGISKGSDSFVRKCELTFLDDGFMGEGLTLNLEGISNLQDGGDTVGDPKISSFTGNDTQFFHVVTMEVYCIKSS